MTKPIVQVAERRLDPDNMEATFALDQDTVLDGKHYRWVKETTTRVARHKMLGYRLVDREDGVATEIEGDQAGDGRIRNGDSILMVCDKARVVARRKGYEDLAAFRTKRSGDEVQSNAKKKGLRSFRASPGEDEEEGDD